MEIRELIKNARVESGLTQEKAAEELNVSRQTVSNWENGKSLPDIVSILKMSDLYHLSLDELLKGDKKMVEKIEKDASYENEQKKYMKFSFWTMCALLIIEAVFLIHKLSVSDMSLSYYLEEMYDTPFIIMALGCLVNLFLYRIADKWRLHFLAKIPAVVLILMLLYVVFDMVLFMVGTYKKEGVLALVGILILGIVVTIVTIKLNDFYYKKKKGIDPQ